MNDGAGDKAKVSDVSEVADRQGRGAERTRSGGARSPSMSEKVPPVPAKESDTINASDVFASIRTPSQVVEREILRVVATLQGPDSKGAFERARTETLFWVRRRTGGRLPKDAWDGRGFDHLPGGRAVMARSVDNEIATLWALRADDPDKNIPGRTWITEVAIGLPKKGQAQMSVRLMAYSSESDLVISPHVPGVVRQVHNRCGLCSGKYPVIDAPKYIETDGELSRFLELLEDPNRCLPVIVASGDERAGDPGSPLLNTESLAIATLGIAHVVILPAKHSYTVSEKIGKARSVFHGAIRMYMSGFNQSADPYEHPLFVGYRVSNSPKEIEVELRRLAARESVRRTRLGHDVLPFADVRSEAARRKAQQREVATDRVVRGNRLAKERIEALERQVQAQKSEVRALEAQVRSAKSDAERCFDLATQEEERAKVAEKNQQGLRAHVQALRDTLSQQHIDPDRDLELPNTWEWFAEWCDEHLAGRLVLVPRARRGIKKAILDDARTAAECVLWLSSTYRRIRMQGVDEVGRAARDHVRIVRRRDGKNLEGIQNSLCGEDEFSFDWQDRRLKADWHVKNGGNTRDPARCLRIYYCYDEVTQQIVVADMPRHRKTGAT